MYIWHGWEWKWFRVLGFAASLPYGLHGHHFFACCMTEEGALGLASPSVATCGTSHRCICVTSVVPPASQSTLVVASSFNVSKAQPSWHAQRQRSYRHSPGVAPHWPRESHSDLISRARNVLDEFPTFIFPFMMGREARGTGLTVFMRVLHSRPTSCLFTLPH